MTTVDAVRPNDPSLRKDYSWMVDTVGNHFRVHTRAYVDDEVFREEVARIFERSWTFVAHVSEIPNIGDYRTSYIGAQPVIVVRNREGGISVLINRCVHRGAALCREMNGNARAFVCPYHGWSYDTSGKLIGITDRTVAGGYAEDFDAPEGLYKVPHVDVYRGLVFANLDPQAGSLDAFLGRAKDLIDLKLDMSPVGEIRLKSKPYVVRYKGNWKFSTENIVDQYHFMYVHNPFAKLQAKFGDSTGDFGVHKGGSNAEMRTIRYRGATYGCQQGHGLLFQPEGDPANLYKGYFADLFRELSTRFDEEKLCQIGGKGAGSIFPNLGFIHHQIRTWRPLGPELTEVVVYPYELVGVDDELNAGMLRSQERFYGPAGYGMPDDVDIFSQNTEGLRGSAVEWLILERGLDSDVVAENGDMQGLSASEVCQRGFWRKWAEAMQGDGR